MMDLTLSVAASASIVRNYDGSTTTRRNNATRATATWATA